MKKLIICFFLLAIPFLIFSQEEKNFRFGLKIGPNLNWLKPDVVDYEADGSDIGLQWGFISDFTMEGNYFLSTGINFCYNNASLTYPSMMEGIDTTGILHRKYKFKYLQLPLTIKMRTNKFGDFAFFGQIGLTGDVNIGTKALDVFEYPTVTGDKIKTDEMELSVTDGINIFKASFAVGGGAEYFLDESSSVLVSLYFYNGLTDVLSGNSTVDPNIKERALLNYLEFSVGIIF